MILLVECLLLCLLCQLAPVLPKRKHPERKRWTKALLAFGTAILLGLFLHLINGAWSFWQGLWESGVLALLFIWYRTLILFWLPERRRKNPEGAKATLKKAGDRRSWRFPSVWRQEERRRFGSFSFLPSCPFDGHFLSEIPPKGGS